ncbi:MAG: 3-methyl-2-oxobutanoate dehydrogenase subunit VorB [Nitrospirae bacterium GWD2_57_9]|nr:MAG: 3-methyl-2-oxobutanoate dehydrogenase subunit VorB [Nitrospirae bacterium GWD2_57_9]
MPKLLITGNEALAEAAVRAGCRRYFGYPITPQNEIPEYLSRRMPEVGGTFVQAESEIAAINMVYGAAAVGERAMTSSSSPGISLMQEALSFMAASELPAVIVNMQRGGPGLGNISPSQADYFQAVKGGGHGDYKLLVYAPSNLQEMADLTVRAFDKADEYRNPVMILGDGILGQMMEPVELPEIQPKQVDKPWALTGAKDRPGKVIRSLFMLPGEDGMLEQRNYLLKAKYDRMAEREVMYETVMTDDAELVLVAFGTSARIAKTAVNRARSEGIKAGLIRPITLFPFPEKIIAGTAQRVERFLVVEMNLGQMVEDVRLAVNGRAAVSFFGRPGGAVISVEDVMAAIRNVFTSDGKRPCEIQAAK